MIIYFIAGMLTGWLIEWLIDWRFWRRDNKEEQDKLTAASTKLQAEEQEMARLRQELQMAKAKHKAEEQEMARLRQELQTAEAKNKTEEQDMAGLRQELQTAEAKIKAKEEEAANASKQLASAKAKNSNLLQHLREAEILLGKHQTLDEKRQKQLTSADQQLQSQEEEVARLQRQLKQMQSELDRFQGMQHQNKLLEEQLGAAQAESQRLQIELTTLSNRQPEEVYILPDDLTKIKGIGPVFESYFNESGIYSFAQLGDLTPERIKRIIGSKQVSKIDAEEWLEHASVLANYKGSYLSRDNEPDDLTRVKGIGSVFEQRLNEKGIYTFAQLAALTASELKELVISLNDLPNVDADDWIRQARQFASKRKKE